MLVGAARLKLDVRWVVILPEAMLQPVGAHLHKHEEVPRLVGQHLPHHGEVLARHGVDLAQQEILVVGAEVLDIHQVLAPGPSVDLGGQLGREGKGLRHAATVFIHAHGAWREEAGDLRAIDRPRRIRAGHADSHHALAGLTQDLPDARLLDRFASGNGQALVAVVGAVAKAVDAERAGVLAGGHDAPGGHCYAGRAAAQRAIHPPAHEAVEMRQLGPPLVKNQLGRRTVETNDQQLAGLLLEETKHGGWRAERCLVALGGGFRRDLEPLVLGADAQV